MRWVFAVILPCTAFFANGRPFSGLLALALQFTGIGWAIGAVWALSTLASLN